LDVGAAGLTRIGKYRLIQELGRGGMGVVYLAEDTRLERQIALKVLHPFLSMDAEFVRRFTSEARAIAALAHKGIVRIHAFEEVDGSHLIDMEYVEGGSLDRHLCDGPLSPVLGLGIALRVFEALAACHARGIIHRDVKPSNILLADDGRVLLSDFGLARSCAVAAASTATSSSFIGTPKYAAPETWEKNSATPAGDVYSAGLVLLELLAGKTPYDGDSPLEIMRKVITGPRTDSRAYLPKASDALVDLIDAMLSPDPTGRPANATIALKHLKETHEILSMPEDRSDTLRITPMRMPVPTQDPQKPRGIAAATLLAILAALIGLAVYVQRPERSDATKSSEVSVIVPEAPPAAVTPPAIPPTPMVNNVFQVGEHIVFAATVGGWRSLWSYDLAAKATAPLWPELTLEPEDDIHGFQSVRRGVVAVIRSPRNGFTLFRTDGTRHGTVSLAHGASWEATRIVLFTAQEGTAYFCRVGGDQSYGIWKTDGTLEGTRHVWGGYDEAIFTGMGLTPTGGLFASSQVGGTLHYFAPGAQEPVFLGHAPNVGTYAIGLTMLGDRALLASDDGKGAGIELWVGGPDEGDFHLVYDFLPGGQHGLIDSEFGYYKGEIVFSPTTPEHGCEPWLTDGTKPGTRLLGDINPGVVDSKPMRFVESKGLLFFNAHDERHGRELWISDGTAAGTRMIRDIFPGWHPSDPHSIRPFNSGVLFTADDGEHGEEIWFSDGTEAGTRLVLDCMPGPEGRGDFGAVIVADRAIFAATHPEFGRVLWETDGTAAGTHPLFAHLEAPDRPADVAASWAINSNEILMTLTTPEHGAELWVTNPATAESKLHLDIRPGPEGSNPRDYVGFNGDIFFVADDGMHGAELWRLGTSREYTSLHIDGWKGEKSGNPRDLTVWPPDRFAFVVFNGQENEICILQGDRSAPWRVRKPDYIMSHWDPVALRPGPQGWLYFSNQTHSGESTIWRTDGTKVERVPGLARPTTP
jgi:ELWxxDGT repeat protein